MKYLVVVEKTQEGLAAYSPDVFGCGAFGDTRAEVEARMRNALAMRIEGLREEGLELPRPESYSTYLEASEGSTEPGESSDPGMTTHVIAVPLDPPKSRRGGKRRTGKRLRH